MRDVVPGANDNLCGVATVLGVAATLAERPVAGLRVVLLSTGSEESFLEGMSAFARRHADEFADADWLVIEMVGSSGLIVPEGEGFLFERGYDPDLRALLIRAAADCAIDVDTDVGVAFTSDAHILLRRGHRAALLGSYDHVRMPVAYHTPDDTPDRLDYDAVADAVRLLDTTVRLMAQR
jgi:Zn-dependent M28 family amino/carboxypeptidase